MPTRRSTQLAIAYSPVWKKQTGIGVPRDLTDLTAAFPVTARNYPEVAETIEEIFDCTGEDLQDELLTRRLARVTLEFDFDAQIAGGVTAGALGVAAAPTGATADEVQHITSAATSGTFKAQMVFDGITRTTPDLAWNITAANFQAALESLSNIGAGNVTVTGSQAAGWDVTYGVNLSGANMPALNIIGTNLVGGVMAVTETTAGSQRAHDIHRMVDYQGPLFTFVIGFRNSNRPPIVFYDVAVGGFTVRASAIGNNSRVTMMAPLVGSADFQSAGSFVMPACNDILPVRMADCRLNLDSVDQSANLREFEVTYSNELLTNDNPYTAQSIDIQRMERANVRREGMTYGILGEPSDPLWLDADARKIMPAILRVGRIGANVTYSSPLTRFLHDNPRLRFDGEAQESVMRFRSLLRKVSGNADTPIHAVANVPQSATYLSTT